MRKWSIAAQTIVLAGPFINSRFLNSNDEQMGSTLFGDAKLAGVAGIVSPQQIEINRGIVGCVSGRD
jgi:hypothetical protein